MSESNIGARKNRNLKDHLLIIYGIINSVKKGKDENVDLQLYDIEKAFDSMWLDEVCNDLYDSINEENRDDKLVLLKTMNNKNLTSIKTAHGLTERKNIKDILQQGGTFGPVGCSSSIDKLGRTSNERKRYYYKYRNIVNILPLTYIDDIAGASICGTETVDLNLFLTAQIELKRLKFNVGTSEKKGKCFRLHIGKSNEKCQAIKAHGKEILT